MFGSCNVLHWLFENGDDVNLQDSEDLLLLHMLAINIITIFFYCLLFLLSCDICC